MEIASLTESTRVVGQGRRLGVVVAMKTFTVIKTYDIFVFVKLQPETAVLKYFGGQHQKRARNQVCMPRSCLHMIAKCCDWWESSKTNLYMSLRKLSPISELARIICITMCRRSVDAMLSILHKPFATARRDGQGIGMEFQPSLPPITTPKDSL